MSSNVNVISESKANFQNPTVTADQAGTLQGRTVTTTDSAIPQTVAPKASAKPEGKKWSAKEIAAVVAISVLIAAAITGIVVGFIFAPGAMLLLSAIVFMFIAIGCGACGNGGGSGVIRKNNRHSLDD